MTAIGVLFYAIGQWRQGRTKTDTDAVKNANDVITTYKSRIEQLESDNKRYSENQHKNTQEIGRLQGIVEGKDKDIARMNAILENRNPELTTFMATMIKANEEQAKHRIESEKLMLQIFSILSDMKKVNGLK